jgi:CelD/BcsL family acetyltransferase involved in cellulose biosynthesis
MLDRRWDDLAASHPRASAFHQRGWLQTLAKTYGYRPMVLTSTPTGQPLSDGVVFCAVKSWITGKRLVSLPFADHAEPLLDSTVDLSELTEWMRAECLEHKWKYIELRPLSTRMVADCSLAASQSFWYHTLSLTPSIERIFRCLHKSSIQRRIRHAEHEQLSYEKGSSDAILNDFYRLVLITRRRHQLLPQPWAWFRNLLTFMSPNAEIRLVRKGPDPIAAILTLRHRSTVTYKYGCSDERFHHLAGMPLLFWRLIEESKAENATSIDFGRTDLDNEGLIDFKNRFGATRERLTYFRYPATSVNKSIVKRYLPSARRLFSVLPDSLSALAGRLAYRHIG